MILPVWAIPNQGDSIKSNAYSPCEIARNPVENFRLRLE